MSIPKVFISYSHDSINHKKWVNELATRMRNNGIDAILDQWELQPGDDLPHFMETHLANSDFIIMVCTERYVEKANKGKGGVGYEKMIITSNLMNGIDSNKVIPLFRQLGNKKIPTFLKTKMYIDFSKLDDFEYSFDELIRTIHKSPVFKKPQIGFNPFVDGRDEIVEKKSKGGVTELMKVLVADFETSNYKFTMYHKVKDEMKTSRVYLDILIEEAKSLSYIVQKNDALYLTVKGKMYAVENKLIKE